MAAIGVALLTTLVLASPAPAVEPAATWRSASAIADPSGCCDLRSAPQLEHSFERGHLVPISSYDDDPVVQDAIVECLSTGGFAQTADGDGPSVWLDAFTLDTPRGERREVVSATWGGHRQAQQIEGAGIVLTDAAIAAER